MTMRTWRRLSCCAVVPAVFALVLVGCGQAGDSGSEAAETTRGETTSATPEDTVRATETASEPGDGGGVPTDLTNDRVAAALMGETVGDVQLNAATASAMEAQGVDLPAIMAETYGEITTDPPQCADTVRGAYVGGMLQSDYSEGSAAVDNADKILITVNTYESAEEAESAFDDFKTSVDDCSEVTMTIDLPEEVREGSVELNDEELSVNGAEKALRTTLSQADEEEDLEFYSGWMLCGNAVVSLVETEDPEADHEALLAEVAGILQNA